MGRSNGKRHGLRAIEREEFPFERLSDIAELESWRKEIHRPLYHIHKWWAQRLGSVFRGILVGSLTDDAEAVLDRFYEPLKLTDQVIFDPFMGSGTTLGEALKLGARAVGRDINPVAYFASKTALQRHDRARVMETFRALEADVADRIREHYRIALPDRRSADVLYYFWVKVAPCPACERAVDLFSSYIFAQHAYAARNPEAQAVCPHCGGINPVRYDATDTTCAGCHRQFDPQRGPARGAKAECPGCGVTFPIVDVFRALGRPPEHRLYAKLVLHAGERKEYLPADAADHAAFERARTALQARPDAYPQESISPGHNTNQVLNYAYTHWHQMFNDRQLLCLSILAERIRQIPDEDVRALFACLFSGCLEFNNMFASYKGEGTGAVRHMFSHHILKPERAPIEANLWGTPKSSGSFSTLFQYRIVRALDYREQPFEIKVKSKDGRPTGDKIYGLSDPIGHDIAATFRDFERGTRAYLSCGDSSSTDIASASVDLVATDPPFFDNVHYSELADFFYVWQRHVLGENGHRERVTTRSLNEVQQKDAGAFADRLAAVWTECARVLKPDGLLVFSYHHSRPEGWSSVLAALMRAGFFISAAHPIKAEMSVAAPKQQAAEPIDLDVILVCRKRSDAPAPAKAIRLDEPEELARHQIVRFNTTGRRLSRNDVRVIFMAQVLRPLSQRMSETDAARFLATINGSIEAAIDRLMQSQAVAERRVGPQQLALLG